MRCLGMSVGGNLVRKIHNPRWDLEVSMAVFSLNEHSPTDRLVKIPWQRWFLELAGRRQVDSPECGDGGRPGGMAVRDAQQGLGRTTILDHGGEAVGHDAGFSGSGRSQDQEHAMKMAEDGCLLLVGIAHGIGMMLVCERVDAR